MVQKFVAVKGLEGLHKVVKVSLPVSYAIMTHYHLWLTEKVLQQFKDGMRTELLALSAPLKLA